MTDETTFLNGALGLIGSQPITAINDGSTTANRCQEFYVPTRKALLRSHHWHFALARAELTADPTPPPFEFTYRYHLPAQCLKVVEYYGGTPYLANTIGPWPGVGLMPRWKIEGEWLLSHDGVALIRYVRDVDNPAIWDALFYDVLQLQLASRLAAAITRDLRISHDLMQRAMHMLATAAAVNGQEGSVEPYYSGHLLMGR